jgi:UDP-N-acetylglucosamine--N-acetylmuramyl-(pentapeptide) pyrophosphoryl-undecaprenol N-acetylglucosamine transferase
VPSPNVAEDHQAKNAMSLVKENAALMIKDSDARAQLIDTALKLLYDESQCQKLAANIARMGKPNATEQIINEIEKLIIQ